MLRSEGKELLEDLAEAMDAAARRRDVRRQLLGVDIENVLDAFGEKHGFDSQLGLDTGPKARTSDPATSKQANYHNAGRRGSQKRRILDAVAAADVRGLTADEAARVTRLPLNSVSTRMSELVRGGFVAYSQGGERRTQRGEKATVYIATPKGKAT